MINAKVKVARELKEKHIVFVIYKRNGKIITHIIKSKEGLIIIPLICQKIASGSLYYTDAWYVYALLEHIVVKKRKSVLLGQDHLNGIE